MERQFDLLLKGKRKHITWSGANGIDAAHRYVDAHRDAEVIAWRNHIQTNAIVHVNPHEGMRDAY